MRPSRPLCSQPTNFDPESTQHRPNLRNRPGIGQIWANFGQTPPKFGATSGNFDESWHGIDQNLHELGPTWLGTGKHYAKFHDTFPELGLARPTSTRNRPTFTQDSIDVCPESARCGPISDRVRPNLARHQPTLTTVGMDMVRIRANLT